MSVLRSPSPNSQRNQPKSRCETRHISPSSLGHPRGRSTTEHKVTPLGEEGGLPVRGSQARPGGGISTSSIDVPVAAAGREDRLVEYLVQVTNERFFGFGLDLDDVSTAIEEGLEQDVGDVGDLHFNRVDDRVESREGVGAETKAFIVSI